MDGVNNNQFEVISNSKRKLVPCSNVYLNPALDLLANDDKICNTAMEIIPKKRKRTKSESVKNDVASFENTGLDLGTNKVVNELLVREIDNVRNNFKYSNTDGMVTKEIIPNGDMIATDNFLAQERPNFSFGNIVNPLADNLDTENLKYCLTDDTLATEGFQTNEIPSVSHLQTENQENLSEMTNPITNIDQTFEDITNKLVENEPIYANLTETKNEIDATINCSDISRIPKDCELDSGISVLEQKSINDITNIQTNISNQVIINNSNISLSFIDRLALDSPNVSDQSLYLDDDLNESNIMEIKTITIITKKKRIVDKNNTNPFLDPNLKAEVSSTNPFLQMKPEIEYQEEILRPIERPAGNLGDNQLMPRRLFDTNSTISTVNESIEIHEYENMDAFRDGPIYENIDDLNKQSKILGHDVSQFSAVDILNLNKIANNSNESKKEKSSFLKAGNKLSKKVFKTLRKTFKHDKVDINTSNPYEVPRKPSKQKEAKKESGIENPALNLDISDDLEIEELSDEEHLYETIKTKRNTEYNMNVTPLKARDNEIDFLPNKTNTPSKKVRFDSTLNKEKVITGNSFDYGMQSPGFDAKIEKYHDELENCINERKFLQQNM